MTLWERATRARWTMEDMRRGIRPERNKARLTALLSDPLAAGLGVAGLVLRGAAYRWTP